MKSNNRQSFIDAGTAYKSQWQRFAKWYSKLAEFVKTGTVPSLQLLAAEENDVRLSYLSRIFLIRHSVHFDGETGEIESRITSYRVNDLACPGPAYVKVAVLLMDKLGNVGVDAEGSHMGWNIADAGDQETILYALLLGAIKA